MSEDDISKNEEESLDEEQLEELEEEKKEQIEETLEDIEEAVKAEVEEEKEKLEESASEEGPITLFLKSPEVENQIKRLKGLSESGVSKTQKNVIVFYEHATSWGDRIRGFIFFLFGLSIISAGLLANYQNYFSLKELISIIINMVGGLVGRVIVVAIGVSLVAYGLDKMLSGLKDKLFPKKEEKKPYVQKKLVEEEKNR